MGIDDFCEAIDPCAIVLQPVAAASALAFLPVAIAIARLAASRRQPALHLLTGTALAMAVGTVAQHASGTWTGMMLDHAGMEANNVVMVLVGLRRWAGWRWRDLLVGGAVAYVSVLVATGVFDEIRRTLMVAGMVPCALLELRLWFREGSQTRYGWFAAGWAAFIAAIVAWELDRTALCAPDSLLQAHALWHVLAAVGLGFWALYYAQFMVLRPRGPDA